MVTAERKSAPDMMSWQYKQILACLGAIQGHALDWQCPCNQVKLGDDGKYNAEFCLGKHLIDLEFLNRETGLMDKVNAELLEKMADEASEFLEKAKTIYCKGGTWPDLAQWSRESRKKIEPIFYSCSLKKAKMHDAQEKQPWEMTLSEFRAEVMAGRQDFKLLGNNKDYAHDLVSQVIATRKTGNNADVAQRHFDVNTEQEHGALVTQAVIDGKPVPARVLADHPSILTKALAASYRHAHPLGPRKAKVHGSAPAVSVSGRCGANIESCKFTIRRKGKPVTVTKEVKQAPATVIPPTCTVIKTHDDGDQTVSCNSGTFVVTTDGKNFKETQARLFDYAMIRRGLKKCNLTEEDFSLAMNYRPLRNLIASALGWKDTSVELCNAGMVPGVYQVTLDGLSINNDEKIMKLVMKTASMKQVYTQVKGQRVYEVVVPEAEKGRDLTWTPQEISHTPARSQGAQAALFDRSATAKASHKPASSGAANEKRLAGMLGCRTTKAGAPFDVVCGRDAYEVKTIVHGDNDKVTMHPDSLARKKAEARANNLTPHTVVFDSRDNTMRLKDGVGSFRTANMAALDPKRERCILKLKARNEKAGCAKPEGDGSKRCPSVFGVCTAAVKAKVSDPELAAVAEALQHVEEAPLADGGKIECAYSVCRSKTGKLSRGVSICGGEDNATIPAGPKCPAHLDYVALNHNHPSGIPLPSDIDLTTSKEQHVPVCVTTTGSGTRCFIINKGV